MLHEAGRVSHDIARAHIAKIYWDENGKDRSVANTSAMRIPSTSFGYYVQQRRQHVLGLDTALHIRSIQNPSSWYCTINEVSIHCYKSTMSQYVMPAGVTKVGPFMVILWPMHV